MGGTETGGDRAADVEAASVGAVGVGVHAAAGTGFAHGADTYVRGRPAYGADALDAIDDLIGFGSGWVADVGAGTGALSSLLVSRGHPVLAVDPVGPMLERCPPGPRRIRAAAAGLPLRRHSLRAITVATAFHWFSTSEALDEFHRCLRPDGLLMLLWNARDEGIPWVRHHTALVDVHAGDAPRFRTMRWRQVVDAHPGFVEVSHVDLPNPTPTTRDGLVDRVMSTSFIAALQGDAAERVRAEAVALAESLPATFDYPYVTQIWVYRPT